MRSPASPETPDDPWPSVWDHTADSRDCTPDDAEEGALDAEDRYLEWLGGRDD